jgi:predicted transcriptional regulator
MNSIEKFDSKYKNKGGFQKLVEMRALSRTEKEIGEHFGVSRQLVGEWIRHLFGKNYDPRSKRKATIIEEMLHFARVHGLAQYTKLFKDSEYYYEVLDLLDGEIPT